jgi:hypothetical protein
VVAPRYVFGVAGVADAGVAVGIAW